MHFFQNLQQDQYDITNNNIFKKKKAPWKKKKTLKQLSIDGLYVYKCTSKQQYQLNAMTLQVFVLLSAIIFK